MDDETRRIEDELRQEADQARGHVDPETLSAAVEEMIDVHAFNFWLFESLEGPQGRVPDHVIEFVNDRLPGFLDRYIERHEADPGKEGDFVQAAAIWATTSASYHGEPWAPAVFYDAQRNDRMRRLSTYFLDQERPHPTPHPAYDRWEQAALAS